MKPVPEWRRVLRHAWSIRLLVIAALLSGLEAAIQFGVPMVSDSLPWWARLAVAALNPVVVGAAFVARLIAQKSLLIPHQEKTHEHP